MLMPARAQLCQQMVLFGDLDLKEEMVSKDSDEVLSIEISILFTMCSYRCGGICVHVRMDMCMDAGGSLKLTSGIV